MSELPTIENFVPVTTRANRKVHTAEDDWPDRTLCGHRGFPLDDVDVIHHWAECKQCVKSRQRRIEGRPQ